MMHFHCTCMTYMYGHALAQESLSRDHDIKNFGGSFLGHHYYIHNLSDPCPSVEKNRSNCAFHTRATPQHKNPCPGGYAIYNFGMPLRDHHYYTLSLSDI